MYKLFFSLRYPCVIASLIHLAKNLKLNTLPKEEKKKKYIYIYISDAHCIYDSLPYHHASGSSAKSMSNVH